MINLENFWFSPLSLNCGDRAVHSHAYSFVSLISPQAITVEKEGHIKLAKIMLN